jgi:dsRNA-specific ribonuclease
MGVLDPNDKIITTATARNKKVAEQEASRAALDLLEPQQEETVAKKSNKPNRL